MPQQRARAAKNNFKKRKKENRACSRHKLSSGPRNSHRLPGQLCSGNEIMRSDALRTLPHQEAVWNLRDAKKTTRPFRCDLNQIPYDYTVEVRNRFKGLDLIDGVPDELWNEVRDIVQRQGSRPSPWKRNAKKQNGCLGRTYK